MRKLHKITIENPQHMGARLDKVLSDLLGEFSRTRLKNLILGGHVRLNQTPIFDPSHKVKLGDYILIRENAPAESILTPQDIPLDIVYEDKDVLVINKPAGMVVHPAPGNKDGTLVNALIAHCQDSLSGIGGVKRPGIVHRLDKDTSGLMVVAKNDGAHAHLSDQFHTRTLSRTYWAFVRGRLNPLEGTININIGRSPRNRKKMGIKKTGGKEAITHYKTLKYYGDKAIVASLVECVLQTGRTHQIRVHLNSLGHPIIGDPLYGKTGGKAGTLDPMLKRLFAENPGLWSNTRQALHAARLKFIHPRTEKTLAFEAELPEDMAQLETLLNNMEIN